MRRSQNDKKKNLIIYQTDLTALKTDIIFTNFIEKIIIKAQKIIGKINNQSIDLTTNIDNSFEFEFDKEIETTLNFSLYGTALKNAFVTIYYYTEEKNKTSIFKMFKFIKKGKK